MNRMKAVMAAVLFLVAALATFNWLASQRDLRASSGPLAAVRADTNSSASNLPVVMAPESTPTPLPTDTPEPTLTPSPTPTASPTSAPPSGGNIVANGSFENGWTDLPPAPGFLINQQPVDWQLTWLQPGEPIWDDSSATAQGVPECLHKLAGQLPPPEQPGGPQALILDGVTTYKMFHFGAPFGSQLYQVASNLPPGSKWRLTVPIQAHLHGDSDPWAAESGAWLITSADQAGGWVPGGSMGDRQWFYHKLEITVPADGRIEMLIRVKSKWPRAKDFFIDDVRLEPLGTRFTDLLDLEAVGELNGRLWLPTPLDELPANEIVVP